MESNLLRLATLYSAGWCRLKRSVTNSEGRIMLLRQEKPRLILTYGQDELLLKTRRFLLEEAGYAVETASSKQEFQDHMQRKHPQYQLLILCHSLPAAERKEISASSGSETLVYSLESSVAPRVFLLAVAHLLSATA